MKKPIPFDDVFFVEEEFPSKWPNTFKVNMWSITWQETSLELTLNVTDLGDLLDHLLSGALFLPCIPSILKSLSQDQRGVSDHGKHCQRPFGASTKMEGGKRVHKNLASSKMYQSLPISSCWWWLDYSFLFSPRQIGEDEPILTEIFSKGLVQPPTSHWLSMPFPDDFCSKKWKKNFRDWRIALVATRFENPGRSWMMQLLM